MKLVFLQRDSFVKLAVEELSAIAKKNGYECDLFIESGEKKFIESAVNSNADLFAFSTTTGRDSWVIETAEKLKQKCSTPVIVGGPHPTFFPDIIANKNIDYVCRGEGEYALLDLLNAMSTGNGNTTNIPNIWAKDVSDNICKNDIRPFIEDLDVLPFPDFSIYSKYRYMTPYNLDMFPVITGRGCPFNCSYCFNKSYKKIYSGKGKYLRRRSPDYVIGQLLEAKEKYNITKINFVDDCFFIFPSWVKEFSSKYKVKIALPFIINVEATHVTEELVKIAKEMGCICFRMGLETGNDDLRQLILNKKVSQEQIRDVAAAVKKHGMKLATYNMLGLPGETLENSIETYTLNKEIKADFVQCSLLQPYPGTEINEYVINNDFLDDQNDQTVHSESFFVTSNIKLENPREIKNLQKLMQLFILFRVPLSLVRKIIRIPAGSLFQFMFKVSFIISKIRTQKIRLIPLIRLGIHSTSYMKESKRKA